MIKTIEDVTSTKKKMSIEIPDAEIIGEINKTLQHFRKNAKFDGFRPGKAPISLVEKMYGKDAESDALEKIVPKYYSDAIKEAAIKPVANPVLESGMQYKRGNDLALTFTVEVRPTIEKLKYDGIEVTDVAYEPKPEDTEHALERLRTDKASYAPTDEAAKENDIIIMDYSSKEDDKSFEGEVYKVGTELMPKAFSDNLTGKKKGDKVEFEAEFPEDYYAKDLAGQKRNFSVEVKEVKKMSLPELDDELGKDLGFDTLDELKARIAERLEESRKTTIQKMQKAELLHKLVDAHSIEAPETLVEGELENLMAQQRGQAMQTGEGPDDAKLREELKENAERNVKASLIIQEIGEKEKIEVSEQEMNDRVVAMAQAANMSPENVVKYYMSKDGSIDGLSQSVFEDKVMEMLVDKAVKVAPKEDKTAKKESK